MPFLHKILLFNLFYSTYFLRVSLNWNLPLPACRNLAIYFSWFFGLVVFFLASLLDPRSLFTGKNINILWLWGDFDSSTFRNLFLCVFLFVFENWTFGRFVSNNLKFLPELPAFPVGLQLFCFERVQLCILKANFLGLTTFLKLFLLSLHLYFFYLSALILLRHHELLNHEVLSV